MSLPQPAAQRKLVRMVNYQPNPVCNEVKAFGRQVRVSSAAEQMDKEKKRRKNLWPDYIKIELFGHNERQNVWRREGEAFTSKNTILELCCWAAFSADLLLHTAFYISKVCGNPALHQSDSSIIGHYPWVWHHSLLHENHGRVGKILLGIRAVQEYQVKLLPRKK